MLDPATIIVSTDIKNAKHQPLIGHPRVIVTLDNDAKWHQYTALLPHLTIDNNCLYAQMAADVANSADADKRPMCHSISTKPPATNSTLDPDLFQTVQSLDNFLAKYPQTIDGFNKDNSPQPQNTHQQPACFKAMFAQQTKVLHILSTCWLVKFAKKIPQIIDALSCHIPPVITKPQLHPQLPHIAIIPKKPSSTLSLLILLNPAPSQSLLQKSSHSRNPHKLNHPNLGPHEEKNHWHHNGPRIPCTHPSCSVLTTMFFLTQHQCGSSCHVSV